MATYTSPQDGTRINSTLSSGDPTGNYGYIEVGEYNAAVGSGNRSVIKFPQLYDGTIPSNSTIISATLYLKVQTDYSNNARTFRIYRLKRNVVLTQCTYIIYSTGNNWQTSGGFGVDDCEQTDIGSVSMSASEAIGTWKAFALTPSAIQEFVSGVWTTPSLLIKSDTELNDRYDFYPYNAATSTDRPYIVVEYSAGGSQVIIMA